jgi:Lon protease-like protein
MSYSGHAIQKQSQANKSHSFFIKDLPLFPLKTVLFPGGLLSLKIFEPRYLEMLTQCEKLGRDFGVCLISAGNEVGQAPILYPIGTLVKITFWEYRKDGLLGVTVKGYKKFKIIKKIFRLMN